ncbi:MAG: hypothetical protein GY707_16245 [Desulfobacteraceae bacterium]|nr:hypothetical protein [Desulfobacteraceae bacterium]
MTEFIANYSFNIGVGLMITIMVVSLFLRTVSMLSSDQAKKEYIYSKIVLHWGFLLSSALGIFLINLDSIWRYMSSSISVFLK